MTSVAAVSRFSQHLDAFFCDPKGNVYTSWWDQGANWSGLSGWEKIGQGGFAPNSPVAAVSRTPSDLRLFVCGTDGHVYEAFWPYQSGGWSDWTSIGGAFSAGAPVTAVVQPQRPDHLDVFACDTYGSVYTSSWDNGALWSGLSGWKKIGQGFPPNSPVAAVSRKTEQLDLFVCGTDGHVYTAWWDSSGWSDWHSIGGVFSVGAPVPVTAVVQPQRSDHLDVFACDWKGDVYTSSWDPPPNPQSNGWSAWINIGQGGFASNPPVAAVSRKTEHLDVFVCGTTGHVSTAWSDLPGGWSPPGWEDIGGAFGSGSPVTAVVQPQRLEHLDLFVWSNGHVFTSWWDQGKNWSGLSGWEDIGGPPTVVNPQIQLHAMQNNNGQFVEVDGQGFTPNGSVTIKYDLSDNSTGTELHTFNPNPPPFVMADQQGNFVDQIQVTQARLTGASVEADDPSGANVTASFGTS